jgi:hypothetical protein
MEINDTLDWNIMNALGIKKDASGKPRKGHDEAVQNQIGAGRWLSNLEISLLPAVQEGYMLLPDSIKNSNQYSQSELYNLALEAGTNGLPNCSGNLYASLESFFRAVETEQKLNVKDSRDLIRIDPKSALSSAVFASYLGKVSDALKTRLSEPAYLDSIVHEAPKQIVIK